MGTEHSQDDCTNELSRRTFLAASGALAGAGFLSTGDVTANGSFDDRFSNWRVREATHAWDRGYRGRTDRTIGLTDSGIDSRHPDLGPWNGVRAVARDGELLITKDAPDAVNRVELTTSESFSGSIGPGTFAAPETKRHAFVVPDGADEIQATCAWSPENVQGEGEDLEFYIEDASGERVASSATAENPETLTVGLTPGNEYTFVVETYLNATADYEITGDYYRYEGSLTPYSGSVFPSGNVTPDTPKVVGWYDSGSRYGSYAKPRDENGHGTHVTSIMAGSGIASAVDPDTVTEDEPQTTLTLGETLSYEVDARPDRGIFGGAYGDGIEIIIEGPNGQELGSSKVLSDTSEWDNNVAEAHTVHQSGTATYTVYVRPAEGESASTGTVDSVSVGAFFGEDESVGDRLASGDRSVHAGIAPNSSVVGLQGLGGATADLARHAETFADRFNMRVVNMSWGYVGGAPLGAAGGLLAEDPSIIKDIASAGILVSAAAGNAGTPANGNGAPNVADETISVVATGPLDGIAAYSSGGLGAYDEDSDTVYRKPDVTAPGGTVTDLARAAKKGIAADPESEQPPIRDYTGKAGTSMAAPYVSGISGLVAEAMESDDAPSAIRLSSPDDAGLEDVYLLKQAILATASETAFTAAPYHRTEGPTYDFGSRDPYEGYGRANVGTAIDAVSRDITGVSSDTIGLNVPEDERAFAGYVEAGPGTVEVDVSFSHLSGGNKGIAKGNPHIDLFVYDAENPSTNGEPNILARTQGLTGDASLTVSLGRNSGQNVLYVVGKLVNVPGAVNGNDVQAHFDVNVTAKDGFFVDGTRENDATVFTGGQTNQVNLSVDPSETSQVRDVVPTEWTVLTEYSDDVARVEDVGDVQHVYFENDATADQQTEFTYFVEAPDSLAESGEYTFGSLQVNPGSSWVDVSGTNDTLVVVGASS
ncbi:S8 family peptidase [Haladaptatus caseinilyticus]|uniref:S8 family peptidase n=1 Tax=Haladaptatus caseinilyticus TaxID=2993314 RepID=UPI00224B0F88|nr:S8 family serine peptidase [Haladaptatus caseinilyticus]